VAINRAWAELRTLDWYSTSMKTPKTGAHHYGHLESIIYVLGRKARIHWGEKL
jgi:uncharacterized RmlC-like cupin family protein